MIIKNILFFGLPGSGKGSLSLLLKKHQKDLKTNVVLVSTGVIFREIIKGKSSLSKELNEILSEGKLVPDELTNKIFFSWYEENIINLKDSNDNKLVILDGYPRTKFQASELESFFKIKNLKIDSAFYLKLDEDEVIKRLVNRLTCPSCGKIYNKITNPPKKENLCDICNKELVKRNDDNSVAIKKRMSEYTNLTDPLINHYQKLGRLINLDGSLELEKNLEIVVDNLNE